MREFERANRVEPINMQTAIQVLRAVGAALGIIAIIFGLSYATRLFAGIFSALRAPENCQALVDTWSAAVGGEQLDIVISGATYHCARIVAVVILGGGSMILAWLSLGLIAAGGKIVSWTLTDRAAIKRVLEQAFGPTRKPDPNRAAGSDPHYGAGGHQG